MNSEKGNVNFAIFITLGHTNLKNPRGRKQTKKIKTKFLCYYWSCTERKKKSRSFAISSPASSERKKKFSIIFRKKNMENFTFQFYFGVPQTWKERQNFYNFGIALGYTDPKNLRE